MKPRMLVTGLALGRLAIGAVLAAKPASQIGASWIGAEEAARPAPGLLFRSVGARDMAIALGTLGALRQGSALRPWLLAATLADTIDIGATFAAGKAVPTTGKVSIALVAGGAVAAQVALATRSFDA